MEYNLVSIWQSFSFTLNFYVPSFIGFPPSYSHCHTFLSTSHAPPLLGNGPPYGSPTTGLWVNVGCHVSLNGSGHSEIVANSWDRMPFLWCEYLVGIYSWSV